MSEDRQPGRSRRALRAEQQSQSDIGHQQGADPTTPMPGDAVGSSTPVSRPPRRRRAADSPLDAQPARPGERESQARARDREALRTYKALADQQSRTPEQPLTRRQLRQQQLEAERRAAGLSTSRLPIVPPAKDNGEAPDTTDHHAPVQDNLGSAADAQETAQSSGGDNSETNSLSVEEALAARSALVEQARNQMATLDASGQQDPQAVDLNVLAEQKKLAERAAVLNQRALAKQRLSEENHQRKAPQNDPAAAHNLAMVTPLEFVKIPGRELPVMKPPTTSHIPVITPGVTAAANAPARDGARSRVLARAEAVASSAQPTAAVREEPGAVATEDAEGVVPISAHTAHGLEPLDAMTAGLGRGNRLKLIQILVVALGAVASMVGLTMILGG